MSHSHNDKTILRIVNARVPADLARGLPAGSRAEGLVPCEIRIAAGRIARILPPSGAGEPEGVPVHDAEDGIVLPRFVDIHTHLDKGHIVGRAPNADGTFAGARGAVMADRAAHWSAEDIRTRMDFALRCALAHGTGAIRTHLDTYPGQMEVTWPVFAEMREAWRDRVALQAVALFTYEMAVDDEAFFRRLVETVARYGGVLGGVTHLGGPPDAKLELALDRLFGAASAHGLDLDFHVDESGAPEARSLERIADAALRHRFGGRVTAGHCCSLALMPDPEAARVTGKLGEAGIAVVSLPMCNMYLQDRRSGRTPRWRGVAPLHELDAAGVTTTIASDNTRDPFYAYGDLDMLEVFREATRILQLDHSGRSWTRLLGATPAAIIGLTGRGVLEEGGPADLVVTRARTVGELVTRPQSDRIVLVAGRPVPTTPPDHRELDAPR